MRLFILLAIFCMLAGLGFAEDKVMIQVRFKEQTDYGSYNDALYFTLDEYKDIKQADIDLLKQQRVDNWVNMVSNPPAYIEPTLDELKSMRADLQEQIDSLDSQIGAKENKIEP